MGNVETSRDFALALADALGINTQRLLSFSIDVGGGENNGPAVLVRAVYAVPQGAGKAASTLIRSFNLIPAGLTLLDGESVDKSTSLMTGSETIHRAAPPAPPAPTDTNAKTPATAPSHCEGCERGIPS